MAPPETRERYLIQKGGASLSENIIDFIIYICYNFNANLMEDIKMTDNELLLAMSEMMDKKIKPIEDKANNIELLLENNVIPRIQNIEAFYTI
ncbi:MAG: hypothetical protein IJ648_07970 [Lachnospiraceae bacterium]|nr:hypothetical protein [Lachnospiraceae bacterium]